MFTFSSLIALVVGYALRHLDLFRMHTPPNPIQAAVADVIAQKQARTVAETISQVRNAAGQPSGSTSPTA